MINRKTYSILDWVGDIGGLLDGLYLIGCILISPVADFARNSKLLSTLFRYRGSDEGLILRTRSAAQVNFMKKTFQPSTSYNEDNLVEDIKKDFQKYKPIHYHSFWPQKLCCRRNYHKMMNKANAMLEKELDLRKFIYR